MTYQPLHARPSATALARQLAQLPLPGKDAGEKLLQIREIHHRLAGKAAALLEFAAALPFYYLHLPYVAYRPALIQLIFRRLTELQTPQDQILQLFWQLDVRLELGDLLPAIIDYAETFLPEQPLPDPLADWLVRLLRERDESTDPDQLRLLLWRHSERTADKLQYSGFTLPLPPRSHDCSVHGLHPVQIRPFFQLLRAVSDVKPIDFEEVEGQLCLRYQLNEKERWIGAGRGRIDHFVRDLNAQLCELGQPHQFVFLERDLTRLEAADTGARITITLLNSAGYRLLKDALPRQATLQFVRSRRGAAPAFEQHISVLPSLRLYRHLAR